MYLKTLVFVTAFYSTICLSESCKTNDGPLSPYLYPEAYEYQKLVRPNYRESPVNVTIQVYLRDVEAFDIPKEELTIHMTIRQRWNDPRLTFKRPENSRGDSFITMIGEEGPNRIWIPDTFIRESRYSNVQSIWKKDQLVRVYDNGDVLMSTRAKVKLGCSGMKISTASRDTECSVSFASYGLHSSEIKYDWSKEKPVEKTEEIKLVKAMNHKTSFVVTATGSYSVAKLSLII